MAATWKTVHVVIDDAAITGTEEALDVIDPVLGSVVFHEDLAAYEKTLAPFTRAQRHAMAVLSYDAEVCNGGHDQFFANPTGIVWRDALEGLQSIGATELASILRAAVGRLGGAPAFAHEARNDQLDELEPDFGDLDNRYYELTLKKQTSEMVLEFIRTRPKEFHFSGDVQKLVD